MLRSFLEIFAAIASIKNEQVHQLVESYVEIYLSRKLSQRIAKQKKEEFSKIFLQIKNDPNSISINNICKAINKELPKGQRVLLLVNLIEFVNFTEKITLRISQDDDPLNDFIDTISTKLNISKKTLQNCENFVSDQFYSIPDQEVLVFAKEGSPGFSRSKYLPISGIKGFLVFFYIEEANIILFKYNGSSVLELNSRIIFPKKIYTLQSGSLISKAKSPIIYYSQVINKIHELSLNSGITLTLKNVEYTHPGSSFGVKNISFTCSTGELIGIIGGSGSGKSTLLNVINGNLKPNKGQIGINGIDYSDDARSIQKMIGFVPQDDSLIGELTVYENLYYTTLLSLNDFKSSKIATIVENKLSEFSLYHIKDQQVGLPIKRKISGGQRKRLNIVSELLREPHMVLVDEPTSGLSSSDSFKIVVLLKEQASKGKLVITNIHQPSSEIFRLFDKILVLDQGGYMIFYGNPIEAIDYFKEQSEKVDSTSVECVTCHTLKPDEIFDIVEKTLVDEHGEITEVRKRTPEDWNDLFLSKVGEDHTHVNHTRSIPKAVYKKPSNKRQFIAFLKRFSLAKLRDKEFITYSLTIPTLLALVISVFSKYSILSDEGRHVYTYYENDNIPIFFLMSVIACLFTGIIITADCMIRDSQLQKREKFLFLNKIQFLNSKLLLFIGLSVVQTTIYTFISILILQIPGSTLKIWLILFLLSIIGNITGIIVSSIIKSAAAAYIVVPFLIIPQIIFSGITIPFEKLNYKITNQEKVPLIGDLAMSRWAIEALLVTQFKDNEYEKYFFDLEMKESQARIKTYFLVPEVIELINKYGNGSKSSKEDLYTQTLINDGLVKLDIPISYQIENMSRDSGVMMKLTTKLTATKEELIRKHSRITSEKNSFIIKVAKQMGSMDKLLDIKGKEMNKGIEKFMLNRQSMKTLEFGEEGIIQSIDPIFLEPDKGLFNAHLFAPVKIFFDHRFDTFTVNATILLSIFLILYTFLVALFRIRGV